jgi:hypothetical protein
MIEHRQIHAATVLTAPALAPRISTRQRGIAEIKKLILLGPLDGTRFRSRVVL